MSGADGFPDLTFGGALSKPTRQELTQLVALMQGWLGVDHLPNGHHDHMDAQNASSANGYREFGRTLRMWEGESINYDATIYSANGAMTWPVTSAQQVSLRAARAGSFLAFSGLIDATNVGGVANTQLRIALPYGLRVKVRTTGQLVYNDAGGAAALGFCTGLADNAYLIFATNPAGNWTITAANNTSVQFTWIGEVY